MNIQPLAARGVRAAPTNVTFRQNPAFHTGKSGSFNRKIGFFIQLPLATTFLSASVVPFKKPLDLAVFYNSPNFFF